MKHPTSTLTGDPLEQDQSRGPSSALKKRASVACQRCRTRKVRCYLGAVGGPCQNCHLDQAQCVVVASRRSRKYRAEKARLSEVASLRKQNATPISEKQGNTPGVSPAGTTLTAARGTTIFAQTSNEDTCRPGTTSIPPLPLPHLDTALQQLDTTRGADPCLNLPTFIARPQQEFRREELRFLQDSGALTIPHSELRDQLLLSFVLDFDPHLPVVDIQALLDAIEGRSEGPVSLFLFQAVMFAGSHFVGMGIFEEAGFKTRVAAKTCYFRRIKVLRDLSWESDRLTVLQASLLHQWWWTSSSELEDPWYWLGVCISLATGIGINHPSTHAVKDERTRRLWKRIWWVCVVRARTFGLVQRKPMRIKDEDIALSPLRFKDFETSPLKTAIPTLAQSFPLIDCVNKVLLADIFMSQTNLLLIAGRILDCSYNLQGLMNSTTAWYLFYTPKKREELDQNRLSHLLEELDTWSGHLNRNCRLELPLDAATDVDTKAKLADNVHVSRAALRLSYLLAQELFHRPLAFTPERDLRPDSHQDYPDHSSTMAARSRVSEAASEIAEILAPVIKMTPWAILPPWR